MKKIALILVISLVLGTGVVHAQEEADTGLDLLPGHPLYFIKAIGEGIGGLFSFGNIKKVNRDMDIVEERLLEAYILTRHDRDKLAKTTINRYKEKINKIRDRINKAIENEEDMDDVAERFAKMTLDHQRVLVGIYAEAPEKNREAVFRALEASREGHESAMSLISDEKQDAMEEAIAIKRNKLREKAQELRSAGVPVPDMPIVELVEPNKEVEDQGDSPQSN